LCNYRNYMSLRGGYSSRQSNLPNGAGIASRSALAMTWCGEGIAGTDHPYFERKDNSPLKDMSN
jgi:hypothetical protein